MRETDRFRTSDNALLKCFGTSVGIGGIGAIKAIPTGALRRTLHSTNPIESAVERGRTNHHAESRGGVVERGLEEDAGGAQGSRVGVSTLGSPWGAAAPMDASQRRGSLHHHERGNKHVTNQAGVRYARFHDDRDNLSGGPASQAVRL